MQENGNTESAFPPEIIYRLAKIEHYLGRAEEYIRMARYEPARSIVSKVFSIVPDHEEAQNMLRAIDQQLNEITNGQNGKEGDLRGNEGQRPVVLLVDQDERVLVKLNHALCGHGYRVIGAGGYQEALALLARFLPDVIVSEVNFESGPVGFDLYLQVSSNAKLAGIPFLFLATTIDRDILIAGKKLGVDDFILKPVDEEVVVASIQHSLTRRSMGLRRS